MRPFDSSIPPTSIGPDYRPDLVRPYVKLAVSLVVVVAIVLATFFFVIKGNSISQSAGTVSSICVCKECGTMIQNPSGLDCEELQCPNCGHSLSKGTVFGGADPLNRAANNTPGSPNQLAATNNVLQPLPLTQNQRETLAEQAIVATPQVNQNPPQPEPDPQFAAATVPLPNKSGRCICPNCGTVVEGGNGIWCTNVHCPNCQSPMIDAIVVGRTQPLIEPREPILIGLGGNANQHTGGGLGSIYQQNRSAANGAVSNAPCPQLAAAPCPQATPAPCPQSAAAPCPTHSINQHSVNPSTPGSQPIAYSNTVAQIVQSNCIRCHGGPIRNLSTYDNLKAYANNGLLMMMIQPGGPMSRFLSADDAQNIISWVKAGSPP